MLIPKIVSACFVQLLSKQDEESLECLVRFLETTGKKFEADEKKMPVNPKQPDRKGYFFGEVFRKIEEIRENKGIPSRIRFMIQDLLEMREVIRSYITII